MFRTVTGYLWIIFCYITCIILFYHAYSNHNESQRLLLENDLQHGLIASNNSIYDLVLGCAMYWFVRTSIKDFTSK